MDNNFQLKSSDSSPFFFPKKKKKKKKNINKSTNLSSHLSNNFHWTSNQHKFFLPFWKILFFRIQPKQLIKKKQKRKQKIREIWTECRATVTDEPVKSIIDDNWVEFGAIWRIGDGNRDRDRKWAFVILIDRRWRDSNNKWMRLRQPIDQSAAFVFILRPFPINYSIIGSSHQHFAEASIYKWINWNQPQDNFKKMKIDSIAIAKLLRRFSNGSKP